MIFFRISFQGILLSTKTADKKIENTGSGEMVEELFWHSFPVAVFVTSVLPAGAF